TAAALQEAYEQVLGQMGEALSQATARFRVAATEVRTMTADIQRELETTRGELRRGHFETPHETQESTAATRRVVADQITALPARAPRDGDETAKQGAAREERPTVNAIELLDSLSVDIARMIDHDAAVELWDRYKRGERKVFTRRLYTLQGQQTFEDVRRKYRGDSDFRETVDRYVDEFERLLGEVARNDRDSMLAKTYLTSETGKVYTMLA